MFFLSTGTPSCCGTTRLARVKARAEAEALNCWSSPAAAVLWQPAVTGAAREDGARGRQPARRGRALLRHRRHAPRARAGAVGRARRGCSGGARRRRLRSGRLRCQYPPRCPANATPPRPPEVPIPRVRRLARLQRRVRAQLRRRHAGRARPQERDGQAPGTSNVSSQRESAAWWFAHCCAQCSAV